MKETIKWTILGTLLMGIVGVVGATLEVLTVEGMAEVIDHLSLWEHYIPFMVCGLAGMILGFFHGRTIEARHSLEEEVIEQKMRFKDLYENAPDMYASIDPITATIIHCNQTFVTNIGYDKEELMLKAGKLPDDVLKILRDNPTEAIEFLRKNFGT